MLISLNIKHAPLKQITKKEIKTKSKPWIATAKDQERKDLLHQQFKNYRNILSNLTKKVKKTIIKNIFKKIKVNDKNVDISQH